MWELFSSHIAAQKDPAATLRRYSSAKEDTINVHTSLYRLWVDACFLLSGDKKIVPYLRLHYIERQKADISTADTTGKKNNVCL